MNDVKCTLRSTSITVNDFVSNLGRACSIESVVSVSQSIKKWIILALTPLYKIHGLFSFIFIDRGEPKKSTSFQNTQFPPCCCLHLNFTHHQNPLSPLQNDNIGIIISMHTQLSLRKQNLETISKPSCNQHWTNHFPPRLPC